LKNIQVILLFGNNLKILSYWIESTWISDSEKELLKKEGFKTNFNDFMLQFQNKGNLFFN